MKNHENLFTQLTPQTTILTPNRRLSATLHKLFHEFQITQHKTCWQTPDILPLSSWILRLWDNYVSKSFAANPVLLNTTQEQFLWEKILVNAQESSGLLQVSETAEMIKSAWSLLKQWQVDISHPAFKAADGYHALCKWITDFQKNCQKNNWIDHASLPDLIIKKMSTAEIDTSQQIMLVGFNELSPQVTQLLKPFNIKPILEHSKQAITKRITLPDAEQEILTIARWAKSIWVNNPETKIACVIPSLDKIRDRVLQVFSEVFAEENTYSIDIQNCPFNISAGKPLTHYPIINTALQLLSLHKTNVSVDTINYILSSPFLGDAEYERIKRANFDAALRRENVTTIDLKEAVISDHKYTSLKLACPLLSKRIQAFITHCESNNDKHSYAEWAGIFNQLLSILGWPGERSLISDEYQIVDSWLKLLTEFMTLDQVAAPTNFYSALQTLQKLAVKTAFQPKTPDAPIQVLGLLEAAGIPFDNVWIAGMDDLSWPPQPKPNPFIPKSLQRELHMPHATAERELLYCKQLIEQFTKNTDQIIFSYAEKNEALELHASPLIRDFSNMHIEDLKLNAYSSPSERIYQSKLIEKFVDENAPPLGDTEQIRGGVNVIKQQALCPFKAFAEWRLHAHALESPLPGLRAKDRGTIIHKVLEIIWNKLQNQETLIKLNETEIHDIINRSVEEALILTPNSRSNNTQYIALEKQRLHKLLREWLDIEKKREPFKVMNNEKATQITLNHLKLSIRIDRIDELSNGKKLIIDYKTGKNNTITDWFSDRPEEPQLPLYLLLDKNNTIGITFAQIHPGENCFKGVSQYAIEMDGIKLIPEIKKTTALSWEQQIAQWNTVLCKLSDDFYYGVAKVDPKNVPDTCTWCALKPFCRINEEINP